MSRVDSEIQKELSGIISRFDDIDISSAIFSITKVETFADFSLSKVYVSVFGDMEKKNIVVSKLNQNKKTIRYELAHKMRFRIVPDLMFIVDDTEEKAAKVLKLFEKIEGDGSNE
jgi:ribosome-binding factor A